MTLNESHRPQLQEAPTDRALVCACGDHLSSTPTCARLSTAHSGAPAHSFVDRTAPRHARGTAIAPRRRLRTALQRQRRQAQRQRCRQQQAHHRRDRQVSFEA